MKNREEKDFPMVLSPNLGCPQLVDVNSNVNDNPELTLIIAGKDDVYYASDGSDFDRTFSLSPSTSGGYKDSVLMLRVKEVEELPAWNRMFNFQNVEDTLTLIPSELHYNVLGGSVRYWRLEAEVMTSEGEKPSLDKLLRNVDSGKMVPALFNLITKDENGETRRINYHAVQFGIRKSEQCKFIHCTDVHVAKRNDEILGEVLKKSSDRNRDAISDTYINFNDNFRRFIHNANEMADKGELDFILISGDLVDYAFHGWETESNPSENNWRNFIEIVTGQVHEPDAGNVGLKVAIFTTTGNHDWRYHPYDPKLLGRQKTYGLEPDEIKHYEYKSYEPSTDKNVQRARLAEEYKDKVNRFRRARLGRLNRSKVWWFRIVGNWAAAGSLRNLGRTGLPGIIASIIAVYHSSIAPHVDISPGTVKVIGIAALAILVVFGMIIEFVVRRFSDKVINLLIANPLNAGAEALHYYLFHINPYFDYAFNCGNNHFIMMDSGSDVFMGNLLDGKEVEHLRELSLKDNILGGSPDSRAFDSEQLYYNWSQIVWLERVLASINGSGIKCNVFLCLHAPPLNPDKNTKWSDLLGDDGKKPRLISKEDVNLSYGTANHFISQLFFLSLGLRESQHKNTEEVKEGDRVHKINAVLTGHAHKYIEFSISDKWVDDERMIDVYTARYSEDLDAATDKENWWKDKEPLILQTASTGPTGHDEVNPPYYRIIEVDDEGVIQSLRHVNI